MAFNFSTKTGAAFGNYAGAEYGYDYSGMSKIFKSPSYTGAQLVNGQAYSVSWHRHGPSHSRGIPLLANFNFIRSLLINFIWT